MVNKLIHGDSLHVLKSDLEDSSVDVIITDPPYGYSFMNKDWDKAVVSVETWKECLRVLKPGAFAAIMSSPRQDVLARMIVNLQDAGFRTDFTSIYWTYASGFPKAANVSKLVDKRLGYESEVIGIKDDRPHRFKGWKENDGTERKIFTSNNIKPASQEAQTLDGSYAGFQPKPAVEVILMVMKPLSEKSYVDQALSNGKGITWLDSCRIPFQDEKQWSYPNGPQGKHANPMDWEKEANRISPQQANSQGRFPANLLVSDDVFNDGTVRVSKYGKQKQWNRESESHVGFLNGMNNVNNFVGDSGSYSRYFDLDKWFDTTFPFLAIPKASSSEKNKGLDQWLGQEKKVNDGRVSPIDNPFQRDETLRKNVHPTVKPLKLMSWLVSLLTRPMDLILDPFCGSGTTCLAAKMLKRKWIGIEVNEEYLQIAEHRIKSFS